MGNWIIYLSSCVSLCFLLILIKFLNKLWWTPIQIQSLMRSQGIKGPPYRFLHGSTKEIINMVKGVMISPMELSHHVFPRIQPHIYSWMRLYGKNFLYWNGPQAHLVVTEPELVKEILNNKDGAYPKPETEGYWKKLLGNGLVSSSGEKWVKHRKLANYAFHAESLKGMIPAMISSVGMMLERWRKQKVKEIELFHEFKVLTSEIISRTAFGSSCLEGENIFDMLTKMALIVSRNTYKIRIPGIRKLVKIDDDIESDKLEQGIRNSITQMIRKREVTVTGESDSSNDFLGLLMKAYHDTDKTKSISVDDLIDECKTFYFAGHETTTSSLTWTLFLLAMHTEWQDKARMEVLDLIGQQNPTLDSISKLKTINMIVHESLRLYPPVCHVPRTVNREVRLGNVTLPEDVKLIISNLALHHDPEIWGEDAHLFKPERFAVGVSKATKTNAATCYLPFGLGPRNCVGSNFANTEIKIVLSMILQRYKFILSPTYIHSPTVRITLYPQHGVKIMMKEI
ncbi:cytochrome P450 CYP749A22-like [Durio zibethinus]|uniref:Cytochrome P450 CYP749A22-like n=1 Tax=Durio zibethinus TaxID=66656 RepID=A0A6P5Y1C6_DURZI|nr:cytochrome P450 CYP749A22-like [Durio zibethinus]